MSEEKDIQKKENELLDATNEKSSDLVVSEEMANSEKVENQEEAKKSKKTKKIKKQILKGKANVKCTYNNTVISISDLTGNVLGWASSGMLGFKGAKKATPYAATQVVGNVAEKVKKYGLEELEVYVKGVGSGREASVRALAGKGFNLVLIKDRTPIPHNGCRPRKPRRV